MDLEELAACQDGVFTRSQAYAAGYSPTRVRRLLKAGRWVIVLGNVLVVRGTPLTADSHARAAVLAAGRGAVLGGPSAAHLHGMLPAPAQACVIVPRERHLMLEGMRLVRTTVCDEDLCLVDGLLVTRPARTVVDCLLLMEQAEGDTLLDRALQQRWITFDELVWRVQQLAGHHGVPKLRRHVRTASIGAHSEAERELCRRLRAIGIRGWVTNFPVPGAGVVDVAFPALKLAIEVDGREWHSAGNRFQADRTKQNRLVAAGWTVLRFTWEDLVQRPGEVVATIQAAIIRLSV
jgi:very-short-patch-repair endonuclease